MVACSQPLAAGVGLEILRKGGNAGKSPVLSGADVVNEQWWLRFNSRCRCRGLRRLECDRTQLLWAWRVCPLHSYTLRMRNEDTV